MKTFLYAFCALSLVSTAFAGNRRALILSETDREGRHAKAIFQAFDFEDDAIAVLSGDALTKSNVVATFTKHLAQGTDDDGIIVLYYHGSGSRVPDLQGDEADANDEIIISNSTKLADRTSWITDDVISSLFRRFPKSNRKALVVFHCGFDPGQAQYKSLGFKFTGDVDPKPVDFPHTRFAEAKVLSGKEVMESDLTKIMEGFLGTSKADENLQVRKALPVN